MSCEQCSDLGVIFITCCSGYECGCRGLPYLCKPCSNGCVLREDLMDDFTRLVFINCEYRED